MEMYSSGSMLENLADKKQVYFQNQIPRIRKTLSKTWGLTSEILNVKGIAPIDNQILQ